MNISELLSAIQTVVQDDKQKKPLTATIVDGYTAPLHGSLWTPEVDYILAYRPPFEPLRGLAKGRPERETDWEQRRSERRERKKLRSEAWRALQRERQNKCSLCQVCGCKQAASKVQRDAKGGVLAKAW